MATIRLTILSSIKEQDGRLPILVCISQKKDRTYIKTEFRLDDISEFENGEIVYRKDAGVMNKRLQFVFSGYKEKYDSIEEIDYRPTNKVNHHIKRAPFAYLFLGVLEEAYCRL